jgi:hypothetical protein
MQPFKVCWLAVALAGGAAGGPSVSPPTSLLAALRPTRSLSAADAISLQLLAMQGGDAERGAELWLRFANLSFRLPGVEPWGAPALAAAVRDGSCQYALLADRRLHVDFLTEAVETDASARGGARRCWHEVELQLCAGDGLVDEAFTAAKLGWECEYVDTDGAGDGGGWRTNAVIWHDFRPAFTPGIGQEDWPRICG